MKFKKSILLYLIPILLVSAYLMMESSAPKQFDWRPVYSSSSRKPMGCSVIYKLLPDIFPKKEINSNTTDLYTFSNTNKKTNQNLVIITESFDPGEEESADLESWVEKGNTLFVSASRFSRDFTRKFRFNFDDPPVVTQFEIRNNISYPVNFHFNGDSIRFHFSFPWLSANLHPETECDTILFNSFMNKSDNQLTCIQFDIGFGHVFIHGAPHMFTNYCMHSANAIELAERTLLHLPLADTYWDEYNKPGVNKNTDELSVLFGHEALRKSWKVLILLMVLFVLFKGKREQKPIPVIEPPSNQSVEFVATLGMLYYENRNNQDILMKRWNFLQRTISRRYSISEFPDSPLFAEKMKMASEISDSELKLLAEYYRFVKGNPSIDGRTAVRISKEIDKFYEKYIHGYGK